MRLEHEDFIHKLNPLTKREDPNSIPNLLDVMIESVGRANAGNIREVRRLGKLADKLIHGEETGFDLSMEEIDAITEWMEKNPAKYFPYYLNQALERFEECQKIKKI